MFSFSSLMKGPSSAMLTVSLPIDAADLLSNFKILFLDDVGSFFIQNIFV